MSELRRGLWGMESRLLLVGSPDRTDTLKGAHRTTAVEFERRGHQCELFGVHPLGCQSDSLGSRPERPRLGSDAAVLWI
jgi:hypothetical protein